MNVDKLFSYLGKEDSIAPDRLLSVIEEAKTFTEKESTLETTSKELEFFAERSRGSELEESITSGLLDYSQPETEVETGYEDKGVISEEPTQERDEIEEMLSVFDNPLPTYEEIKNLTIPDFIKEAQEQIVSSKEEVKVSEVPEIPEIQPTFTEVSKIQETVGNIEDIDLLKDFKIGEIEERQQELSTEDLESIMGISEVTTSVAAPTPEISFAPEEEQIEEKVFEFPRVGGTEEGIFGVEEERGFEFPSESEERIVFGEEPVSEEVESIVRGIENAEKISFEQPLEDFFEGLPQTAEPEPFEKITQVSPEERIYSEEFEEKLTQTQLKQPEYVQKAPPIEAEPEGISDADAIKAISLLKKYPSDIRRAVKELIENGIMSEKQANELLSFILNNPTDDELRSYLKQIAPFYRFEPAAGRRVIMAAKKSKTEEALEKILKRSVIVFAAAGIIAIVGFIVFTTVSRNIYSENLYNRGLNLIDAGYYDEAESLFNRAEEIGGRKIEWYNTYALRYLYNNVPERAVDKLEKALKIWPYDYRTSLNYVEALTRLPTPDFNKALKYSEEFRRVEDNSFRSIDLNAQVYIKMGDYYKAKSYYRDAEILYMKYLKAKDNKHIPSLFRLIPIYIRLDDKNKVDEIYDYIKKLDEKAVSEQVGIELSRYYIDKNDLARAKNVLFELSTINSKDPDFYYEFARYLFKNENYRESLKNLKISTTLNPKHAKSYVLIGNIEYLLRNKTSAIENYKRAIEIDPLQKEAYFKLGDIFYQENDFTTALGYYLEGLKIGEPEDVEYLSSINYNIAKIYYNNGMLSEALKYLSYSYIRDPQNPLLSQFIGNIYLELGKPDLALVQYNKSIDGYLKILETIPSLNPKLERHREIASFLIRTYNNQGVAYIQLKGNDNIRNAMLSWWEAKNYAEKINSVYPNAEYNLKLVLHPTMTKLRNFSFDKEIPNSIPEYIKDKKVKVINKLE